MIESSIIFLIELSLAQWVGILAYCVGLVAFTRKNGQHFKFTLILCQAVICLHFFMMGAIPGAFSAGLSCVRTFTSTRTRSTIVMWLFILLITALGLYNLKHAYELLTILGACVATWGMFRLSGPPLRLTVLFCSACWLIHNILLGSIGGTLMETSFIIINGVTIMRLQRDSSPTTA